MMKKCVFLGILASLSLFMNNAAVGGAETVFDITSYGAKGDTTTDDAIAFIRAWRAGCDGAGPSRVLVPAGRQFMMGEVVLSGPCKAAPPVIVDIQGTLLANTDPSSYSSDTWILVEHVDNVKITGGGTLNGRGQGLWNAAGDGEDSHLPVSLSFQSSTNGEISNLKMVDAMGFHSKVMDSVNVKISGLNITAPEDSPNTDGIHLSNATNVDISDCTVATGDDCVSVATGSTNIYVHGVKCGPGHGLAVGSLGKRAEEVSVKNISFINCSCTGTTNGARIKSCHASPAMSATSITYQDITMENVTNPIIIDQHCFSNQKPEPSNVKISDVHFKNIKGTTASKVAVVFNCSSKAPCDSIELADIDLKPVPPLTAADISSACESATNIKASGTLNPPAPAACG